MKRLYAALSFFTRLPIWKLTDIPAGYYARVVELWPVVGWLTGGITALALRGLLYCLPTLPAVIAAYVVRLLLTGALHEDGLADFIDGMGGGHTRNRILEIMKDSHIGSYGVLGLICYYLLLVSLVASLPAKIMPLVVFAADPWGKFCAELIVRFLPYARKASEAKNRTVYLRIGAGILLLGCVAGLLPAFLLPPVYSISLILPLLVSVSMILYMQKKIGGYTGDCCGATFLCCELSFIFSAVIITNI